MVEMVIIRSNMVKTYCGWYQVAEGTELEPKATPGKREWKRKDCEALSECNSETK